MADFNKAYKKVAVAEGGYVNDPDDAGGETYKGVSRKANPNWIGWVILDDLKKHHPKTFESIAKKTPQLEKAVWDLYKKTYWDCFNLDNVPNQLVAEQLFDTNVNCGKLAAVTIAQRTVGVPVTGKWDNDLFDKLAAIK